MKAPRGWPATLTLLKGRKVKTLHVLKNGFVRIPAGTVMTVGYSNRWDGLSLIAPACAHCGVEPCISGVSPQSLELLPHA